MADAKILEDLSIEELRAELRARKARYEGVLAAPASESLKGFDDATIIGTLKFKQKVIYGADDRQDRYEVSDAAMLADADSVVAIFQAASVNDNGDGTSTLNTENFGDSNDLCQTERFRDQPIGAFCCRISGCPGYRCNSRSLCEREHPRQLPLRLRFLHGERHFGSIDHQQSGDLSQH